MSAKRRFRSRAAIFVLLILWPWAAPADDTPHSDALHFAHPLVGESPSPDTKLRLDYLFFDASGHAGETHTARLEGELAFARWVSLEVDLPYTFRDPEHESSESHLDTVEVGLKLASYGLAEHGLLLGGGLELGLPTGSDSKGIGSNRVLEFEPFVDFGWQHGPVELTGFFSVGIPHNGDSEEADSELGWNLSALYRPHPRLELLVELDGEEIDGGAEDGHTELNLSPGLKLRPFAGHDLWVGASVGFPVTDDHEFDTRAIASLFWHF